MVQNFTDCTFYIAIRVLVVVKQLGKEFAHQCLQERKLVQSVERLPLDQAVVGVKSLQNYHFTLKLKATSSYPNHPVSYASTRT